MGFFSFFEFFVGRCPKELDASDFSVVKADVQLGKISEKLIDLKNIMAEILLNMFQDLTVKYSGLTTPAKMARGEGVSETQVITNYSFAPCISVSVGKNFLILHSFSQGRSNVTEAKMLKLLFVQYNMIFLEISYDFF